MSSGQTFLAGIQFVGFAGCAYFALAENGRNGRWKLFALLSTLNGVGLLLRLVFPR